MSRKASRPQLEPIEARVLTTVFQSPVAFTHAIRQRTVASGAWTVTSLANHTGRDITYWITEHVRSRTNLRHGILAPNDVVHYLHYVPPHGPIPIFHATYSYHTKAGTAFGNRSVPPFLFNHRPNNEELASNPTTYEFRHLWISNAVRLLNPPAIPHNPTGSVLTVTW